MWTKLLHRTHMHVSGKRHLVPRTWWIISSCHKFPNTTALVSEYKFPNTTVLVSEYKFPNTTASVSEYNRDQLQYATIIIDRMPSLDQFWHHQPNDLGDVLPSKISGHHFSRRISRPPSTAAGWSKELLSPRRSLTPPDSSLSKNRFLGPGCWRIFQPSLG